MPAKSIRIRGLEGIPEIQPGMNLAAILLEALMNARELTSPGPENGLPAEPIILVVAQKVVSKAEGCLVRLDSITPSAHARAWATRHNRDPRLVEIVLRQSRRVVRKARGILIVETHHGYICANAGVDVSNAPAGMAVLLPPDPDKSALSLRRELEAALGLHVAVIISDTFGRPWRRGLTNVAIGVSGLSPFIDYRGRVDSYGRTLHATLLAAADELAGAAELVMEKTAGIPAAVIEGCHFLPAEGSGRELIRPAEEDLFLSWRLSPAKRGLDATASPEFQESEGEPMTAQIPEAFMDLVREPAIAQLGTVMKNGSPHVTPVWFDYDGSYISINSARGRVKDRNMRNNPRVALSILDPKNAYRYMEIRGKVIEITEEGAVEHIDSLARKYLNVDRYPHHSPSEVRVRYRILPEHVSTMG